MKARQLKFRGKRIDMDRWVYGDYFKTPLTDENSGTVPQVGWFFLTGETRHCIGSNSCAFVINPSTLGQFTGLLDKDGNEIYEGDIVKMLPSDITGTVYWHPDLALFQIGIDELGKNSDDEKYISTIYSTQVDGKNTKREVIGNIHEPLTGTELEIKK